MSTSQNTVESVIRIASRLIALLAQETGLLREMKTRELSGLQEEKTRLVAAYEAQVRELAAFPDAFREIAPVLRDEFAEIAERFEAAMTDNRRALSAAGDAQRRFFDAVVSAAEEKRANFRGYSAAGKVQAPGPKRGAPQPPLSLTLDRQL